MTNFTCPKCRQGMADDALDVGQCPACGFPLDGPMVLAPVGARGGGGRMLVAAGLVAALAGGGAAGYYFLDEAETPKPQLETEFAALPERPPVVPSMHVAPFPHEPQQVSVNPTPNPKPVEPPGVGNPAPPVPVPVVAPVPKREGPRPVAIVMKVDPKIAAVRNFDHPDDIAAVPDLNTTDKVVLTGRVRALRIGAVNGKGSIDASGLVAEEITVSGDLSSEATLKLNAPAGKVTFGGFVYGSAKVTVAAPGGEVVVAQSSRVSGGAVLTVTAKRFEANGPLSGAGRVNLMLTPGASLKFTLMEEGAMISYKKAALGDPAPLIERGQTRGGARVIETK